MQIKHNILIAHCTSFVYQGWSLQLNKQVGLVVSDSMSGALKSNACSAQLQSRIVANSNVNLVTQSAHRSHDETCDKVRLKAMLSSI